MLGRTDTRTREMMKCQTIRTVSDISRDDRARIATCSLRTPTDRQTDFRRIIVQIVYLAVFLGFAGVAILDTMCSYLYFDALN